LDEELVAAPDAASVARRLLGGFLEAIGWSRMGSADLILAVSEAVANATRHGYPGDDPGMIVVRAQLVSDRNGCRRVWLCASDSGRWRRQLPGRPGLGLRLMRAATAHLTIDVDAAPTRVTMISSSKPPPS
jgi:anti-sigma regulatory factor (Ser/Thr protein kinase)